MRALSRGWWLKLGGLTALKTPGRLQIQLKGVLNARHSRQSVQAKLDGWRSRAGAENCAVQHMYVSNNTV